MAADLTASRGGSHQSRFFVAFVALALVVGAVLVLTGVMYQRERPAEWSSFTPSADDPVDRANEISAHVQGRYLNDDGSPVVTVTAGEDVIPDLPHHEQIAAIGNPTGPPWSFESGSFLFYKQCGPAAGCALDAASPTVQQSLALAVQQAEELALRGLKHVGEASSIIVVLPSGVLTGPDPNAPPTAVMYWTRDDLERELDRPLTDTVPETPGRPGTITPEAAAAILADAAPRLFTMNVKPAPDQSFIVYELTPAPNA